MTGNDRSSHLTRDIANIKLLRRGQGSEAWPPPGEGNWKGTSDSQVKSIL